MKDIRIKSAGTNEDGDNVYNVLMDGVTVLTDVPWNSVLVLLAEEER